MSEGPWRLKDRHLYGQALVNSGRVADGLQEWKTLKQVPQSLLGGLVIEIFVGTLGGGGRKPMARRSINIHAAHNCGARGGGRRVPLRTAAGAVGAGGADGAAPAGGHAERGRGVGCGMWCHVVVVSWCRGVVVSWTRVTPDWF